MPPQRFVDPVTDVAHLERAALHAADTDLTREATAVEEEPETVGRVEVPLPLPGRAPRPEGFEVEGGVGAARFGHRLPTLEPLAAPQPDLAPRLPVVGLQRSEEYAGTQELESCHALAAIASSVAGSSRPDMSPGASPVTIGTNRAAKHLARCGFSVVRS